MNHSNSDKTRFWARIPYAKCPIKGCQGGSRRQPYETKMRWRMIAHLESEHELPFMKAKNLADSSGVYCPEMYRPKETKK
jgi:hypothetical protein